MNLRWRDLLSVLLGGAIGAMAGFLVSYQLKAGTLPQSEQALGLRGVGLLFGGVGGAAITLIVILFRRVHDPNAEPSRNFTAINGIGSTLVGKWEAAPDGSYVATEWFIVFFVPIFPVCRYRVTKAGRGSYKIHAKYPPRAAEVATVYAITILAVAVAVGGFFLLKWKLLP